VNFIFTRRLNRATSDQSSSTPASNVSILLFFSYICIPDSIRYTWEKICLLQNMNGNASNLSILLFFSYMCIPDSIRYAWEKNCLPQNMNRKYTTTILWSRSRRRIKVLIHFQYIYNLERIGKENSDSVSNQS